MNIPQSGERLGVLENEVRSLHSEVAELRKEIAGLLDAWKAATGLVKFIKFLSMLIAAVGSIKLFLVYGVTGKGG